MGANLQAGETAELSLDPTRHAYLVAVNGPIEVNGRRAEPRDGVAIIGEEKVTIRAIEDAGGTVIAAASIVDRSGGDVDLGVPYTSLIRIDVPTYEADALPPELEAIPAIKPGSRAAA
jgi:hypothetical protein